MLATTSHTRRTAGFTLAEIMVSIVVMALLAVIALPASAVSDKHRLDMLQLQLQDAVDHSQSIAYHTGQKAGVLVNIPGQWFAVVNELGVPFEDPLTKRSYVIKLNAPGQEQGVEVETCLFGFGRPLILFNDKGQLIYPGEMRLTSGDTVRQLEMNTATGFFDEVPISG